MKVVAIIFLVLLFLLETSSALNVDCFTKKAFANGIKTMKKNARNMRRYQGVPKCFRQEVNRLRPAYKKKGGVKCYSTIHLLGALEKCAKSWEKNNLSGSTRMVRLESSKPKDDLSIFLVASIRAKRGFCRRTQKCCIWKDEASFTNSIAECFAKYCTDQAC